MSEPLVDLIIEEPGWHDALPALQELSNEAAELALRGAGLEPDQYSVSLLACDDNRMMDLNSTFRGSRNPTNVLSWPAIDLAPEHPGTLPQKPPALTDGGRTPLGDVAIGLQTCEREAEDRAVPLKNHVTHLILHGCLHLLGFDHETDTDADIMEGIERRALLAIGIPDPYDCG